MAFLTNYTFSKLSRSIDHTDGIELELFLESVWDDKRVALILNRYERQYLFNYVMLLKDEEGFVREYFEDVPEHQDSQKYVFEKNYKSKYHLKQDCKFMKRDFIGYIIPKEIRDLGDDAVYEFRDWFKEEKFVEIIDLDDQSQLIMRYNLKYPNKYPDQVVALDENHRMIDHFENSQSKKEDYSLDRETLIKELNSLVYDYKLHFPCPTTRKIAKWHGLISEPDIKIKDKLTELFSEEFINGYGLEKAKEKLSKSKNITNEVIKNLIDHFKWSYSLSNKDFKEITLENFGLVCCNHCKQNSI